MQKYPHLAVEIRIGGRYLTGSTSPTTAPSASLKGGGHARLTNDDLEWTQLE